MQVSVEPTREPEDPQLRLGAPGVSPIQFVSDVAPGVRLGVDLLAAGWCSLTVVRLDACSAPIVAALAGADHVPAELRPAQVPAPEPWLRIALADTMDRWLALPVDESLLAAERGLLRAHAALTLPPDSAVRVRVLGEALRLVRRSARVVVSQLRRLGPREALPATIHAAAESFVDGHRRLASELDGPDQALDAVVRAWRGPVAAVRRPTREGVRESGGSAAGRIDPRLVPARVLAVAAEPDSVEIRLAVEESGLRVRVPAFDRADPEYAHRLLARLTGHGRVHALAVLAAEGREYTTLLSRVPDLDGLEVEIVDTVADPVPATGASLRAARAASSVLAGWRALVATATVHPGADLGPRLRALVDRTARPVGEPLFPGGPTAADLLALDGEDTGARIRAAAAAPGPLAVASLLFAELVAAL